MKELKVGDRVRAYDGICTAEAAVARIEDECVVLEGNPKRYHRKQLRKLVQKERRRVWLDKYQTERGGTLGANAAVASQEMPNWGGPWLEFVEARSKK